MLYGLTGTLSLDRLATVSAANGAGFVIAVTFVVVAVAFKFGAVPFHMWSGCVSRRAGERRTADLHGAKAGFLRAGDAPAGLWPGRRSDALGADPHGPAVLSLLAGNLIAIAQASIRRMLAYSAIANVGFILLASSRPGRAVTARRSPTRWCTC